MRFVPILSTSVGLAAAAFVTTAVTTAAFRSFQIPQPSFVVIPTTLATDLLNALWGDAPGLSNFAVTTVGAAAAFGTFSDDPFGLASGVVLSTGQVIDLPGENLIDGSLVRGTDLSTNFGNPGDTSYSFDLAQLDISFDADNTVEGLQLEYVFGSEEFKEFAGSLYNDSFEVSLNGVNVARLSNGDPINTNNLVPHARSGMPINPDYIDNSIGVGIPTRLDGFTRILTFEGPLNRNTTNTLSIRIKDIWDGNLDSATFLKGKVIPAELPPPVSVPEPNLVLGLLITGGMALSLKQQVNSKL